MTGRRGAENNNNERPSPLARSTSSGARPPLGQQKKHQQLQEDRLYYPSIFRYKCRGALHLSSDNVGSPGSCRGLQSRLEHVRDLHPSTRDEAANVFLEAANYDLAPPPAGTSDDSSSPHAEAMRTILQTQALIYEEETNEADGTKKHHHHNNNPETPWNDWSCYGSTEVHLLVLRNVKSNKEQVAGVAPDCHLGVSVRDVGTEANGGGVVATIRAGPLEVNLMGDYYDDQQAPHSGTANPTNQHNTNHPNTPSSEPTPYPSRDGIDTNDNAEQQEQSSVMGLEKLWNGSQKVAKSMQRNADFLKNELSDEFPSRMASAGQRIVGQFGKTMDRTTQLMSNVYKMWRDDDDDRDE